MTAQAVKNKIYFLDIATPLIQRGWKVIPLKEKIPVTKNGVKDASKDPEQIKKWAKQFPHANVGVATGRISNLVVIDVDGMQGLESLSQLTKDNPLPKTLIVRTGNGYHHYFAYPHEDVDIRNSAGQLGKHIDVRGNGGYVVGPGSLHPDTETIYEISEDIPLSSIDPSLFKKPAIVLVEYPLSKIRRRAYNPEGYINKVIASVCDEIATTSKGGRNTIICKESFVLGRYIPHHLDEQIAIDSLFKAASC
jgi:hypothetical protein